MVNDNIYRLFDTLSQQSLPPFHPGAGMTYLYLWQDNAKKNDWRSWERIHANVLTRHPVASTPTSKKWTLSQLATKMNRRQRQYKRPSSMPGSRRLQHLFQGTSLSTSGLNPSGLDPPSLSPDLNPLASWVVSYDGKTIPRWWMADILKISISPYLSEKSSDFY